MSNYRGTNPAVSALKKIVIFAVVVIILIVGFTFAMDKLFPIEYSESVEKYSMKYKVDEALIYGVIKTESNFDANAVSNKDAKGLMQIREDTFKWVQTKMGVEGYTNNYDQIFDSDVNIKYGTYLLSILLNEYGNDPKTALCAYYAGRDTVNEWLETASSSDGKTLDTIPNTSVEAYVNKVMRNTDIYEMRLK